MLMETRQAMDRMMTEQDVAKRVTSALYYYVSPDEVDVPRVVEMYEWVREARFRANDRIDLPTLAREWSEHERDGHDGNWLMRAFGE